MLWVDKHRPKKLSDLSYHDDITKRFQALAENPSALPHLFVYGPCGAGKQTRIRCLLYELFGASSQKLKLDQRTFTTPTNRTVDIHMITSPNHIEMSPGDAGRNDRFVVQDVIKEMASTKNISSSISTAMNNNNNSNSKASASKQKLQYKVVVLLEVDQLTTQAQAALRRTMERHAATCRLILCCNAPSKVMEPVRSRCLGIRVAAPTKEQICNVMQVVANKERRTLPDGFATAIAGESGRNLRRALLMMESAYVEHRDQEWTDSTPIPATDWQIYIRQLAGLITREQSPATLLSAREQLYELLVHCIPPTTIIKTLADELTKSLDDVLKVEVMEWAAFYEHRMANGSKEIFHLEAFVAKYMAIYKRYLNELFG